MLRVPSYGWPMQKGFLAAMFSTQGRLLNCQGTFLVRVPVIMDRDPHFLLVVCRNLGVQGCRRIASARKVI